MDDPISRQAAIDAMWEGMPGLTFNEALKRLRELPTAEKKGKWVHDGSRWENRWICSECGYKWFFECARGMYCPNCGAKMEGESDGK